MRVLLEEEEFLAVVAEYEDEEDWKKRANLLPEKDVDFEAEDDEERLCCSKSFRSSLGNLSWMWAKLVLFDVVELTPRLLICACGCGFIILVGVNRDDWVTVGFGFCVGVEFDWFCCCCCWLFKLINFIIRLAFIILYFFVIASIY